MVAQRASPTQKETPKEVAMHHGGSEASPTDVVAHYELEGFSGQFGARPAGRIICFACRRESKAQKVLCFALHRFEGTSDPGEQTVLAALECPRCAARGTLMLAYGPGAPPEDGSVLLHLSDVRGATGIRPGL